MRFNVIIISVLLLSLSLSLAGQHEDSIYYDLDIGGVTIQGRPRLEIKDIGPARSDADSLSLRESITVNLAELLSGMGAIYVKSYGRSTLSTASFRGMSPNHTQVIWNGMKINSPMLGMVDLSTIPSFFIDKMEVSSGPSTVAVAPGGLGGAIELQTEAEEEIDGYYLQYVQGISSYSTFDQYLDFSYAKERIKSTTKLYYASSKNDFNYINYKKKVFVFDDYGNITDSYYPRERNKNGRFKDLHALQEIYIDGSDGSRWGASVWFMGSQRGIPMLNVDYRDSNLSYNRQDEITFRSVLSWNKEKDKALFSVKGGYTHTDLNYVYLGATGNGDFEKMVDSRSSVNTLFISSNAELSPVHNLSVSLSASLYQHFVKSVDNALAEFTDDRSIIGYDKARFEPSAQITVKYRPWSRIGLATTVREDIYGKDIMPPVPALFVDYLLSQRWNVKLKSSFARNFRYPTLNDLYFRPGGNEELEAEKGYTYDLGMTFGIEDRILTLKGDLTLFGSKIKDWILWLPTNKGPWSPINIKRVDSHGLETKADLTINLPTDNIITLDGSFSVTRSVNKGDPIGLLDESIGKQLVYIPLYSSTINGMYTSDGWKLIYSWNYYSKRYTTTSNDDVSGIGVLGDYFMNDISLEKAIKMNVGSFAIKIMINNLFNEGYESVLRRPMPGRNYSILLSFNPDTKKSVNDQ